MVTQRVFVTGPGPSGAPPKGGRLRATLQSFSGLPRALKLVWETSPVLALLLGLATLGQAGLPAATAWAGKLVIDAVVRAVGSAEPGWTEIIPALVFSGAVALTTLVLGALSHGAQDALRERLTYHINTTIVRKSLTLDLEFFETPQKQDMLQRATTEATYRPLQVLQSVFTLVQLSITLISLGVLLARFRVWVLALLAVTGVPSLYVQTRFSRESYAMYSGRAPLWRKLAYYGMLLTQNWHVKEVKLFGLGRHLHGRYDEMARRFAAENTSLALRRNAATSGLGVLSLAGYLTAFTAVVAQALRGAVRRCQTITA